MAIITHQIVIGTNKNDYMAYNQDYFSQLWHSIDNEISLLEISVVSATNSVNISTGHEDYRRSFELI